MVRDITIGQYYPAKSVIHKLDPRVKLLCTILFIISLFLKKDFIIYGVAALFLFTVIKISKVPFRFIVRGLKPIFFILIFSCLMNLFFTKGTVVWTFWKISVTKEGIILAFFIGIRLIFLILGSSIMTFTTTANELTDGIEKGLGFLNHLKVPVHEFAMMMSIALRFIPILTEELDKIMKAQAARCANFEEGNLIKRVKSLIPVLIPLFVSAVRRANDLALAMEARCYHGGEGRTKLHPLHYKKRDGMAYGIMVLYLTGMIILKIVL